MTPEQRRHSDNGVWLCGNCAKLVDNDEHRYSQFTLRQWKSQAELRALIDIEQPRECPERGYSAEAAAFARMEQLMPDLLAEMRQDLAQYPLSREFVLLKRAEEGAGKFTLYFWKIRGALNEIPYSLRLAGIEVSSCPGPKGNLNGADRTLAISRNTEGSLGR